MPTGERQPESPVASWSMFSLPMYRAPASRRCCTAGAVDFAVYVNASQVAVVFIPSTSMLSFSANGMPYRGGSGLPVYFSVRVFAAEIASSRDCSDIQTAGSIFWCFSILSKTRLMIICGSDMPLLYLCCRSPMGSNVSSDAGGVVGGVRS